MCGGMWCYGLFNLWVLVLIIEDGGLRVPLELVVLQSVGIGRLGLSPYLPGVGVFHSVSPMSGPLSFWHDVGPVLARSLLPEM